MRVDSGITSVRIAKTERGGEFGHVRTSPPQKDRGSGFQVGLAVRLLLVLTVLFAAGIALAFAPSAYILATTNDLKSLEPPLPSSSYSTSAFGPRRFSPSPGSSST